MTTRAKTPVLTRRAGPTAPATPLPFGYRFELTILGRAALAFTGRLAPDPEDRDDETAEDVVDDVAASAAPCSRCHEAPCLCAGDEPC